MLPGRFRVILYQFNERLHNTVVYNSARRVPPSGVGTYKYYSRGGTCARTGRHKIVINHSAPPPAVARRNCSSGRTRYTRRERKRTHLYANNNNNNNTPKTVVGPPPHTPHMWWLFSYSRKPSREFRLRTYYFDRLPCKTGPHRNNNNRIRTGTGTRAGTRSRPRK